MPKAPRISGEQLERLLGKRGYGISGGVGGGIGKSSLGPQAGCSGSINNVEPNSGHEQVGSEGIQIRCPEKVRVRIKFYRRRLADYSRAISEKAGIDALQYAGLLSGDSEKEILLIDEGQVKVDTKEEERTEIVLEYPEVDFDNLWEPKKRKDGR